MNNNAKELIKINYLISKIDEIEKTISDIEDKIYEESLYKDSKLIVESILYLFFLSIVVFLMIYLNKYLLVFSGVLMLVSVIYFVYFYNTYKDKRAKEKLLNTLVTDKFNLENFLEAIPKKSELLKKYEELKTKDSL